MPALSDRLHELIDAMKESEQAALFSRIGGNTLAHVRKFLGLCQRCGEVPPDGSGIMCQSCWVDTGPWDREVDS
jgi:hypothetical protein